LPNSSESTVGRDLCLHLRSCRVDFIYSSESWACPLAGYWMNDLGSNRGRDKTFVYSPKRQDRLWGPPSLVFNGYWGKARGHEADY